MATAVSLHEKNETLFTGNFFFHQRHGLLDVIGYPSEVGGGA
jgi:hypothetical protein